MKRTRAISVVGLGKLGSCLVTCLASRGFRVLGFDINRETVDLINQGKAPVVEPGLSELMDQVKSSLTATTETREIMEQTDTTFIVVPTPSEKNGEFSVVYLEMFFKAAVAFLKNKKRHHLFVITSTVSPGTIDRSLIPFIEKYSGKKLNKDFSLCYNPEFIALGSVIHDMLNPDLVLIGESQSSAGTVLEKIYRRLCDNKPHIIRMSIINAEIAKLSLNAFVTTKISFANTLGSICEKIPGADVDVVTRALGADRRISPHYLKAGSAFGGPCFPRDNLAFGVFAKQFGVEAPLAQATDQINTEQIKNLLRVTAKLVKRHNLSAISVLGLSYKTNTPVIEESSAVRFIENFIKCYPKIRVYVYDPLPLAIENARQVFKGRVFYSVSLDDCLQCSTLWLITTPHIDFASLSQRHIKNNPTVIIDTWRILNTAKLGSKVEHITIGKFTSYLK